MPTDWGAWARAIHIVSVVIWIGGVSLATTALLPGMRRKPPAEWLEEFEALERRFAPQARIFVILAGLSGLYMLHHYDLWSRLLSGRFWWMHLMIFTWSLFALMLFLVEPLIVHHWVHRRGRISPASTLELLIWLHRALLTLGLVTIVAAVAGAHGGL